MGYAGRNGNCYGRGDYYRGDYYRGDYYRGDFLGIGHALGGIAKTVAGVASFALNPAAGIASIAGSIIKKAQPPAPAPHPNPLQGTAVAPFQGPLLSVGQGIVQGPAGLANFAMNLGGSDKTMQQPVGTMTKQGIIPVCGIKGTHQNKSGYYKRAGQSTGIYIPKGSVCVKNRSMNPANGRALRRALRRATAFKRMAMKSIRLLSAPGKKHRFGGFKTKGRKRA
jgi:hypothetical protein